MCVINPLEIVSASFRKVRVIYKCFLVGQFAAGHGLTSALLFKSASGCSLTTVSVPSVFWESRVSNRMVVFVGRKYFACVGTCY